MSALFPRHTKAAEALTPWIEEHGWASPAMIAAAISPAATRYDVAAVAEHMGLRAYTTAGSMGSPTVLVYAADFTFATIGMGALIAPADSIAKRYRDIYDRSADSMRRSWRARTATTKHAGA